MSVCHDAMTHSLHRIDGNEHRHPCVRGTEQQQNDWLATPSIAETYVHHCRLLNGKALHKIFERKGTYKEQQRISKETRFCLKNGSSENIDETTLKTLTKLSSKITNSVGSRLLYHD